MGGKGEGIFSCPHWVLPPSLCSSVFLRKKGPRNSEPKWLLELQIIAPTDDHIPKSWWLLYNILIHTTFPFFPQQ